MKEILRQQSFTLEDGMEVIVTYSLIKSNGNECRPYGIRAEMNTAGKCLDAAQANTRFATKEETAAVAKILANNTVTPMTLNYVI